MMVVIAYDVNTETAAGRKRLRKVAKKCLNYGQRVQNSIFECIVDESQFRMIKNDLEKLVDLNTDSLRFYKLGKNFGSKIEHSGAKAAKNLEGPLIF